MKAKQQAYMDAAVRYHRGIAICERLMWWYLFAAVVGPELMRAK